MLLESWEIMKYVEGLTGGIVSVTKGGKIVRKNCFTVNITLRGQESRAFREAMKIAIENNLIAQFAGRTVKMGKVKEQALFFVPTPY